MKKNIFAITAAAALVLNIAATSVTAFAAEGDDATPAAQKGANTDAKAKLTDTDDKGNKNAITLDKAPSIDFGSKQITSTGAKFDGAVSIADVLQVSNPGVDSGWSVSLAASDFTGNGKTLKGATFSLKAGATSLGQGTQSDPATPAAYSNVQGSNQAATVLSAADGTQGVGVNTDTYDKANASLDVPAGNVAGDYTATLTWTLSDAPTK
jgi:hypothetical protein